MFPVTNTKVCHCHNETLIVNPVFSQSSPSKIKTNNFSKIIMGVVLSLKSVCFLNDQIVILYDNIMFCIIRFLEFCVL